MGAPQDTELAAMKLIEGRLMALAPRARRRVLSWVVDRVEEQADTQPTDELPPTTPSRGIDPGGKPADMPPCPEAGG